MVVDLQMGPDGRLYYVNFDNGKIYAVEYFPANQPPTAVISASATNGLTPLVVHLDGSGSSDPEDGANLLYAWDLDGDGEFDDSSLAQPNPSPVFNQAGVHVVGLRVQDPNGARDFADVLITAGNTPPVAQITSPSSSLEWIVGEPLELVGEAIDPQDGLLPASRLKWKVLLHHCHEVGNCHTHEITTVEGMAHFQFPAPDHSYPSWLEFRLTAEDLAPVDWLDPAWKKRRKLTFDNSGQSQTLTGFPVLVVLDPSRIDYGVTQPGGADLRFADAAGTPLPFEIESWNPGGVSTIWVKVPLISAGAADDYICMYYDNPAAGPSPLPASDVWSNGYGAVWHLGPNLVDSTANANDGSDHGTSDASGQIDRARLFGTRDWIDMGSGSSLQIAGQLTLEAWLKIADGDTPGPQRLLSNKVDPDGGRRVPARVRRRIEPREKLRRRHQLHLRFRRRPRHNELALPGDRRETGQPVACTSTVWIERPTRRSTRSQPSSESLHVGSDSDADDYKGSLDELRVSNVQRSPSWIAAQNLAMRDAFIAYGAQETPATLTHTTTLALYPKTVDVEISSEPSGLRFAFGEDAEATPFTRTVIVGSTTSISALTPQSLGGVVYKFGSFSDGGAAAHDLIAGHDPISLLASFGPAPACGDGLDNDADTRTDLLDPGCENDSDDSEQNLAVACDDGLDNDGDMLIDLLDPDCADPLDGDEQTPLPACDDAIDNDGDGLADAADPGCVSATDPSENSPELVCDDGVDEDADGRIDYPADAGCADPLDDSERDLALVCDDGIDNDGDGLADAADPGCAEPADASEQSTALACDDGADNDGDQLVDGLDPGCASPADPSENAAAVACDDGADDDGDGLVDAADPGCSSASDPSEKSSALVCDDGVDEDGDGQIDYPADAGCASPVDDSEQNTASACDDGVDNDGDGLTDTADPGCDTANDTSEKSTLLVCDDGIDNDGDAQIDYPADPDCQGPSGALEAPPAEIPVLPPLALALLAGALLAAVARSGRG